MSFPDLMTQIKTGEIRMTYNIHDHQGKPLPKDKAAHVVYQWALDQQYVHYVDEVNTVHSIHQHDDVMKFIYLGTSSDNKLAEGSELRTLCNYIRTLIRKFGLAAMPPDYGNTILPPERLHVTPPTHNDFDVVQIQPVPSETIEHLNKWKGRIVLPHLGTPAHGHTY